MTVLLNVFDTVGHGGRRLGPAAQVFGGYSSVQDEVSVTPGADYPAEPHMVVADGGVFLNIVTDAPVRVYAGPAEGFDMAKRGRPVPAGMLDVEVSPGHVVFVRALEV